MATALLDDGEGLLAVGDRLRRQGLDLDRATASAEAAVARVRARERWELADRMLFTRSGLEQASDPAVSSWRARRFAGAPRVVDLAAGVGGDTIALGRVCHEVIAVDRDEARLVLLRHNSAAHGVHPLAVAGDALSLPLRPPQLLHVDPSRRGPRGRARRLADYTPAVGALEGMIAAAEGAAVVVSPAVDLDDPDLPAGEVEFVQVGRDLVEAVVWTGNLAGESPRSATIVDRDGVVHRSASASRQRPTVRDLGEWLIEPAAAAVRARLHDELGTELSAGRLSEQRALLTSSTPPGRSPWYRAFPVEAELPPRPRQVRAWLREQDETPVEVVLHGVQTDVDTWWRELGRPTRGWGGRVVHLIRTGSGARCVVTGPPEGADGRSELPPPAEGDR